MLVNTHRNMHRHFIVNLFTYLKYVIRKKIFTSHSDGPGIKK